MNIGKLNRDLEKIENDIEALQESGANDDDIRIVELNKEANELANKISKIQEIKEAVELEYKKSQEYKKNTMLNEIRTLHENENWDELFKKYGKKFINDYTIMPNGDIISYAKSQSNPKIWSKKKYKFNNPHDKIKQLIGYRIYNIYFR